MKTARIKVSVACLACMGALALTPTSATGEPRSDARSSDARSTQQLTFTQKLSLFLFGTTEAGQPGVECGEDEALNRPGHSEDARGSAFHEGGVAGQHYAGEQPQNSKNPKSVSQYDVACEHAQSPQ